MQPTLKSGSSAPSLRVENLHQLFEILLQEGRLRPFIDNQLPTKGDGRREKCLQAWNSSSNLSETRGIFHTSRWERVRSAWLAFSLPLRHRDRAGVFPASLPRAVSSVPLTLRRARNLDIIYS